MSHGIRKGVPAAANKVAAQPIRTLPPGVEIISEQGEDGWRTRVVYGGVYMIDGIVMQSVYHEGVLSLGVNHRRINTVYQFDQNGELLINSLSRALAQDSDVAFFICPSHPGKIYIRHTFLQKTFPIIGGISSVQKHYEVEFALVQEHTKIDLKSGDISQKLDIHTHYRAIIDPANALSTLVQYVSGKWEVLSVSDLLSGKQIYARRAFSGQSASAAIALHTLNK